MDIMSKRYPVKLLEDDNHVPFIPFVTADAVFINGTDETAYQWFMDRYTKAEIDKKFEDLGTVMDFKGVVETENELPESAEAGDVYLVLHYQEGTITHGIIWDGEKWVDMGTPINLDDYYTKTEVDSNIATAVSNSAAAERVITTNAIADALASANNYTDDSILALNIDNYYTKDESDNNLITKQNVRRLPVGTQDQPAYLDDLNMNVGETIQCILEGYIRCNNKTNTIDKSAYVEGPLIYKVTRVTSGAYQLSTLDPFTLWATEWDITEWSIPDVPNGHYYMLTNSVFDYYNELEGKWNFVNGITSGKDPIDDSDVVTLGYLKTQVIEPTMKLINRLAGKEV